MAQIHLTGKRVASDFGPGSELEITSTKILIGALPTGLRIYNNLPTTAPAPPEGDYVVLLGPYDSGKGVYYTVGGSSGMYSVKADGSLHQQCVQSPSDDNPIETSDGVSLSQLLAFIATSMKELAPQAAAASAGASVAARIPNSGAFG